MCRLNTMAMIQDKAENTPPRDETLVFACEEPTV
jgi:hypothetical protein